MKKLACLLLAAVFGLCVLTGCGNTNNNNGTGGEPPSGPTEPEKPTTPTEPEPSEKEVDNSTYGSFWMRSHDYKTMPITAFNSTPPKIGSYTVNYFESEQTYKDYAAAGVNTMMGMSENTGSKAMEQALKWCEENGLSYIVPCGGADNIVNDSIIKSTLSRVKYYDAFGGVMQFDEPGRTQFEAIAMSKEKLEALMPADTKGALWHCNLFPLGAEVVQYYQRVGSNADVPDEYKNYTFEQYVADYMEICKPQVLSYDNYPLRGKFPKVSNSWFTNISIIRKHALQANVPFWVYIQACSFSANTRIPTQAELSWLVNTALSYGAKGLQYFAGACPNSNAAESFSGCLFDRDGNKTDVYEYAKVANAQVAAVDEVLMCSHSKGIIPVGASVNSETFDPADVIASYGALTETDGAHSIVGCFDYDGKDAYYVTNNSLTEAEELTLTFGKSVKGYVVQNTVKTEFSGDSLKLNMTAGDGVLVVLESAQKTVGRALTSAAQKLEDFTDGFESYEAGDYIENTSGFSEAWENNIMKQFGEPQGMDSHLKEKARIAYENGSDGNKVLAVNNTTGADSFFYVGPAGDFRVKNFTATMKIKFLTEGVKERSWVGFSVRKKSQVHYTGTNNMMFYVQRYAQNNVITGHAFATFDGGSPSDLSSVGDLYGDKLSLERVNYTVPGLTSGEDSDFIEIKLVANGNNYKMYANGEKIVDCTFDVPSYDYYGKISINCCTANVMIDDVRIAVDDETLPPEAVELAAPEVTLNAETHRLSWNRVQGADGYRIIIDGKAIEGTVYTAYYTKLDSLELAPGDHEITVIALAGGSLDYKDSKPSEKITFTVAGASGGGESSGCGGSAAATSVACAVAALIAAAALVAAKRKARIG